MCVHSLTHLKAQAAPPHAGPGYACFPRSAECGLGGRKARGSWPWVGRPSSLWQRGGFPFSLDQQILMEGRCVPAWGRAPQVTPTQALSSVSSLLPRSFWVDLEAAVPASCRVLGSPEPGTWPEGRATQHGWGQEGERTQMPPTPVSRPRWHPQVLG